MNAPPRSRTRRSGCRPLHGGRADDEQIGQALDALIRERDACAAGRRCRLEEGGGSIDDALADLRGGWGSRRARRKSRSAREICGAAHWRHEHCGALVEALVARKTAATATRMPRSRPSSARASLVEADGRIDFFLNEDDEAGGLKCRSLSARFGAAFRKDSPGLDEKFARRGRPAAAARQTGSVVARLRRDRGAADRRRRDPAILSLAKRRAGALDFSRPDRQGAQPSVARRRGAMGALQARPRRRPHPRRRGAGHQPRPMAGGAGASPRNFSPAQGATRTPPHHLRGRRRQAVDLRLPGRRPAHARRDAALLREEDRGGEATRFVARAAAPVVPLDARGAGRRRHGVRQGARAPKITASTYEAHPSHRDDQPGHVMLLPRTVRQKTEEPEDWTAPFDAPSARGDAARRENRRRDRKAPSAARSPPASASATAKFWCWSASATPSPPR